ncbi:MAG: CCA tRNA nucleotidyltransferase [Oscillospiraceae bacterium]
MITLPDYVKTVIYTLNKNGYKAYAVGGCIRDSLLGKEPYDYDVCTDCPPDKMEKVFNSFKVIETGLKHGTLTVIAEHKSIEVTTFRYDGDYINHRKPKEVKFVSDLTEDLKRRDFTVNAMCCDINGKLFDYFNGQKDLKNKLIKCVGNPEKRFEEDALRILRALRFASTLDFEIDRQTRQAIFSKKDLLRCISAERISAELKRLLCGKAVTRILMEYREVFAVIIPEIIPCFGYPQHTPHHCYTVWEHIARSVGYVKPDPTIRTAMLLHDIGKPQCETVDEKGISHFKKHPTVSSIKAREILKRLKYDTKTLEYICELIYEHDNRIASDKKTVAHFASKHDFPFLFDYLEIRRGDTYAQSSYLRKEKLASLDQIAENAIELMEQDKCLKIADLKVNGNDLKALGFCGKEIGDQLKKILDLVIDEQLENDKNKILDYVKESQNEL